MSTLKVGTIQDHANSNDALVINSSGATALTVPHFFADESSSITVGGSQAVHTGFTEVSDSHGGFSGHTYTIPTGLGGIWCFNTAIAFNGIGGGSWCLLALTVNGSVTAAHDNYIATSVTNNPFRGIHMGSFNAGDSIRFAVAQGTGSNKTSDPNSRTGFFSGWRMGSAIT